MSHQNIIDYCMLLNDPITQLATAKYVMNILDIYKEEMGGPNINYEPPTETRYGRKIKKPIKLDL